MTLGAAGVPQGFVETAVVASGISAATAMEFAPDGRIFVCQQTGEVRVIKNGVLLANPFVTFSVDSTGERGLLGLAFDPDFAINGYVYFYYTVSSSPRHNRIVRVTSGAGDTAVAGSEVPILALNDLTSATNHNGGAIHFGVDGKLYAGVGDNNSGANSQTLSNLLGKLLRINKDGSIPPDNPFYFQTTGSNGAIWATGLRNPFTFAVQPGSGKILINDVGQVSFEEINEGFAGANYGWPSTEGMFSPSQFPAYTNPVFAYGHTVSPTTGCAISGGSFYNPPVFQFPGTYLGSYFFADLCSGWIRQLDLTTKTASGFATGINFPVDIKVGPDGALYYLSRGAGGVFRIAWGQSLVRDKIGAFGAGLWLLDFNGNYRWDGAGVDRLVYFSLGFADEQPVAGDWNGSGTSKIGVYRDGVWLLDYNGNGVWDGPGIDRLVFFGGAGFVPAVGDWNGSGTQKIGAYRDGLWLLDYDGNFSWGGASQDKLVFFGAPGYLPVTGDWNGSGSTKIGAFKDGTWLLDLDGDFQWGGLAVDRLFHLGGAGHAPLIGDWNGSGTAKVGASFNGTVLLDYDGSFSWSGPVVDRLLSFGGAGLTAAGRFSGVSASQLTAYQNGLSLTDLNGNLTWDPPSDALAFFGGTGQRLVVGRW